MDVDYLREALHEDSQLAGPPPTNPYERVLAKRQKSDRRRLSTLAAGLAVLMVAVLVPAGLSLLSARDDRVATPPTVPEVDVFAGPTRGSLASDATFLQALTQLSWSQPGEVALDPDEDLFPNPPVETRHVAFAGDVPSGRWALVVGPNTAQPVGDAADPDLQTDLGSLSEVAGVWFVGPPEATPDQMQMVTIPRGLSSQQPTSLYDGTTGSLVVVAAPGDSIEISPRPEIAADATMTRTFVDAGAVDGVAVTLAEANPYLYMPAVVFRVSRANVIVAEQGPDGYTDPNASGTVPDIELEYLRPKVGGLPAHDPSSLEQRMAAEVLSEYGLASDQVDLQVHYAGPAVNRIDVPTTLSVLTATFSSGAVLIRADYLQLLTAPETPASGAAFGGGSCLNELTAAGAPVEERILALRCDIGTEVGDSRPPGPESTLIVLVPPGLGASSVVADGDSGPSTIALSDPGLAFIPFPDGAETVLIRAADGTVLDEVTIRTL